MERARQRPSLGGRLIPSVIGITLVASLAYGASLGSEKFTNVLGALAVGAFAAIVTLITAILLRDAAARRRWKREAFLGAVVEPKRDPVTESARVHQEEVDRLESENTAFFEQTVDASRERLRDLVIRARSTIEQIGRQYGARVTRGEANQEVAYERFRSVIGSQWEDLKSDLGYASIGQIDELLAKNRDAWKQRSSRSRRGLGFEESSLDSRGQAVFDLFEIVGSNHLQRWRGEFDDALDGFRCVFDERLREWIAQTVFHTVVHLKERGREGVTIDDTSMKSRIVRLKNVFELVNRFSDRLSSRQEEVEGERGLITRIVDSCVALDILSHLPEWFPEMGETVEAETRTSPVEVEEM